MRAALAFLTPLGGARSPSPRALPWFPVVGALVGLGVGGAWWIGTETWNPAVGSALAIVADLALTGMLHHDGLGDSADGLLPHLSRDRRLEVMRQPDIGAYGVAAIGTALLLRFAVLTSMSPRVLLVMAAWALSRALAAATIVTMRYARPGGIADAFRGAAPLVAIAVAAAAVALGVVDLWAVAPTCIGFLLVVGLARRQVGGYTGDVLGAAIVVAETFALLAAAA